MEKKGVEMSMNVIIIAAIGLLILVVVVYLIANSTTNIVKGKACVEAGGICKDFISCDAQLYNAPADACKGGQVCCRLVPG